VIEGRADGRGPGVRVAKSAVGNMDAWRQELSAGHYYAARGNDSNWEVLISGHARGKRNLKRYTKCRSDPRAAGMNWLG